MGLLSAGVSITRYQVQGKLKEPLLETVAKCLKENAIPEIDEDTAEKTVGWTSFEGPFQPNFDGSSFVIGPHFVFSLRIDKKTVSSKIIKKQYAIEEAKRLAETGQQYLSRDEKKMLKEHVLHVLFLRIPATPDMYDLVWNYEDSSLWFFSNLRSANEELETLFSKSFQLNLIRLFPYTIADLTTGLSEAERDVLSKLSPTIFKE